MTRRFAAAAALLVILCSTATAQAPGPGLTWSGSSGNSAGSFFPSCANLPVAAVAGETVTLRVWGDPQTQFALGMAPSGSQCVPFPGIGGGLVLDPPLLELFFGVLTQFTPCLSCPPTFAEVVLPVPPGIPRGASAAFQGLGTGGGNPAFTVAITATVR
jgi:hypothetical protein